MRRSDLSFSDPDIVDADSYFSDDDGVISNGLSLIVNCPDGADSIEVTLDYKELKLALEDLDRDREAYPNVYSEDQVKEDEPDLKYAALLDFIREEFETAKNELLMRERVAARPHDPILTPLTNSERHLTKQRVNRFARLLDTI